MRKPNELTVTANQETEIRLIIKQDRRYRVRNRANAILYKTQSYGVEEIAQLLNVRPQTVYLWIRKFEKDGIESFYDKKGRGRRRVLTSKYEEEIKKLVLNQPSLSVANAQIQVKLNIYVHNETLRRYLKKNKIQLYTSSEKTSEKA